MKAISVIMPVYNVENYIEKCLESIINQQFDDFELIVVDDCSIDKSVEICKTRLTKSRIDFKIIQSSSNNGPSTSRNIGLKNSSGRFISFVDSDDWADPLMLKVLYEALILSDADIASGGATRFWEDSGTFSEIPNLAQGIYSSDEYLNLYFTGNVNPEAWGRLYRRNLFDSVEFPTKINYEDLLTLPFLIKQSKGIVQVKTCLYYYVQRESKNSITDSRPINLQGILSKLKKFKLFETSSQSTKLNSKRFAYRHLLAMARACIFHSRTYKEAKVDMTAVRDFIDTLDLVKLNRGPNAVAINMIILLKCSPFLVYQLHKITWQLKGFFSRN